MLSRCALKRGALSGSCVLYLVSYQKDAPSIICAIGTMHFFSVHYRDVGYQEFRQILCAIALTESTLFKDYIKNDHSLWDIKQSNLREYQQIPNEKLMRKLIFERNFPNSHACGLAVLQLTVEITVRHYFQTVKNKKLEMNISSFGENLYSKSFYQIQYDLIYWHWHTSGRISCGKGMGILLPMLLSPRVEQPILRYSILIQLRRLVCAFPYALARASCIFNNSIIITNITQW